MTNKLLDEIRDMKEKDEIDQNAFNRIMLSFMEEVYERLCNPVVTYGAWLGKWPIPIMMITLIVIIIIATAVDVVGARELVIAIGAKIP